MWCSSKSRNAVSYICYTKLLKFPNSSFARFASSKKSIAVTASDIHNTFTSFCGVMSNSSPVGFVNRRCRLIGCGSVADLEFLVREEVMLKSRYRRNDMKFRQELRAFSSKSRKLGLLDGTRSPRSILVRQTLQQLHSKVPAS